MATKIAIKTFLKHKLATDQAWALKALAAVFANQTESERQVGATVEDNGCGFSGCDAEFLTSLAKQAASRGTLSPKQMVHLHKKIARYHGQIEPLIVGEKRIAFEQAAEAFYAAQRTQATLAGEGQAQALESHLAALAR
jgi:hypothetical protein